MKTLGQWSDEIECADGMKAMDIVIEQVFQAGAEAQRERMRFSAQAWWSDIDGFPTGTELGQSIKHSDWCDGPSK